MTMLPTSTGPSMAGPGFMGLGASPQGGMSPATQALMMFGSGLLSGDPRTQGLARGFQGMAQAYSPQAAMQRQLMQGQLEELQRRRAAHEAFKGLMLGTPQTGDATMVPPTAAAPSMVEPTLGGSLVDIPGGGTEPGQVQTAMRAPEPSTPAGAMMNLPASTRQLMATLGPQHPLTQSIMAQAYTPKKPVTVAPGGAIVNPYTGDEIYRAPPKAQLSDIAKLRQNLDQGLISQEEYDRAIAIKSKPLFSMPGQETEEAKAVGKWYGEKYTQIQDAADASRRQISNLNALDKLLEDVYTGQGGEIILAGKKLARMLGADPKNIGSAEAAVALANEQALQLRNPAGGAGMPGAMSDRDRDFLESMVPGLGTTKEGRKLTIEVRKRMAERNIEVARMARDYRRRNGRLDEGFYDELDAKFRDSDMFGDLMKQRAKSPDLENRLRDDPSSLTDEELRELAR